MAKNQIVSAHHRLDHHLTEHSVDGPNLNALIRLADKPGKVRLGIVDVLSEAQLVRLRRHHHLIGRYRSEKADARLEERLKTCARSVERVGCRHRCCVWDEAKRPQFGWCDEKVVVGVGRLLAAATLAVAADAQGVVVQRGAGECELDGGERCAY